MNISKETSNTFDRKDDLKMTFHDLLHSDKMDEYSQKCRKCSVLNVLNILRTNNVMCDVTLVSKDKVEINAHKLILSSVSEYFFTKFTKYNEDRLLLEDFDSSTLKLLVSHAYTSDVTIDEDQIEIILRAADFFGMENLKDVCGNLLLSTMTLSNCLNICSIADLYSCKSLLSTCDDFIKENFTELIRDEKFSDFTFECLIKIIQDDDLNVPSEFTVYTAVTKWVKHDLEKRQKHLYELMRYVRLPFLGKDRLIGLLRGKQLSHDLQQLFFKALMEENLLTSTLSAIPDEVVPTPRASYSSIPKIFVIGRRVGLIEEREVIIDCYDIRHYSWRIVAHFEMDIPTSAVSKGNKIYAIGYNEMKIFDVKLGELVASAETPIYRYYHTSVFLNDKIYVIGGEDYDDVTSKSVDRYCLKEEKWFSETDMTESRTDATAAVLNGKIYVAGGSQRNNLEQPWDTVEYYDPATLTWSYCKSMNHGRCAAAACVVDNLLCVVGGKDSDGLGDKFEVYDPKADKWELMPNLPTPRYRHGVCYENGYLFVVGGKWDGECISHVDVFCCDTKKWFTMRTGLNAVEKPLAVVMAYESPD